jgi:hypothetical protein
MIEFLTFGMVLCMFIPFALDRAKSVFDFVKGLFSKIS